MPIWKKPTGSQAATHTTQLVQHYNRWSLFTDNRWITCYDDLYGPNHYNATESAGIGSNPIIEYEHLGLFVPAGTVVKDLTIINRVNSSAEITDLQFVADLKTPEPARWLGGYDDDAEDSNLILLDDTWIDPADPEHEAFTSGAITDIYRRVFSIDHTVDEDSELALYMKPVGTITATRYAYLTHIWTLEHPTL